GSNNKFGYFPSIALAWKINEESFLNNAELISNLKLRASWGQTGNQEIGNYQSISTFGTGNIAVFNNTQGSSVAPSRIANPNLKWETSEQLDLGLDFGILNNRIFGSIERYSKTTKDMLFNLPMPRALRFSTLPRNVGSM